MRLGQGSVEIGLPVRRRSEGPDLFGIGHALVGNIGCTADPADDRKDSLLGNHGIHVIGLLAQFQRDAALL